MDLTDIPQAQSLMSEYQRLGSAFDNFGKGGRIVSVTVSAEARPPGPKVAPIPGVIIPTDDWEYPPQMVEAIKALIMTRRAAVAKELADMGVTGVT